MPQLQSQSKKTIYNKKKRPNEHIIQDRLCTSKNLSEVQLADINDRLAFNQGRKIKNQHSNGKNSYFILNTNPNTSHESESETDNPTSTTTTCSCANDLIP